MSEDASNRCPIVSVIMPVHNQERELQQTLESIEAQTLKSFELICVDDGSTDGSVSIERAFKDADPRMRLFLREHKGAANARDFGLGQVQKGVSSLGFFSAASGGTHADVV